MKHGHTKLSFGNYLLVMLLTPAGLLFILYTSFHILFNQVKDSTIAKCQNEVARLSIAFNNNVFKSRDILADVAAQTETMLRQKRPIKDIRRFFKERVPFYQRTMNTEISGLIGQIRGHYIDSTGWVPPKTFIPTQRSWYKNAVRAHGKSVLATPYHDAETGLLVITLSTLLNDGKSVIAIDKLFKEIAGTVTDRLRSFGDWHILDRNNDIIAFEDAAITSAPSHTHDTNSHDHDELKRIAAITDGYGNVPITATLNGIPATILCSELFYGWKCVTIIHHDRLYKSALRALLPHFVISTVITLFIWAFLTLSFSHLRKERDKASEAETGKEFFFAALSHDIRTPLNAITGFSQAIRNNPENSPDTSRYIDYIIQNGQTLNLIINDVLDLAKLEAEKITYLYEFTDFEALVRETAEPFLHQAQKENTALTLHIEQNFPYRIRCDEARSRQIFANFISNAVKFTANGTVDITVTFNRTSPDSGILTVSVTDTGIGFSEDVRARILNPYVQIGHDKTKSTGIGLHISKLLIEQMNGELYIHSEPGKGSRFIASFPKTGYRNSPDCDPDETLENFPERHVLIACDIKDSRESLRDLLKQYTGASSELVSTAQDALRFLNEHPCDAVFVGHCLPNLENQSLVQIIRKQPNLKNIPVYLVSADTIFDDTWRNLGFTGLLKRPVTPKALTEIFRGGGINSTSLILR